MPLAGLALDLLREAKSPFIGDTGGVDHAVQFAKASVDTLDRLAHLCFIRHVRAEQQDFSAPRLDILYLAYFTTDTISIIVAPKPCFPCVALWQGRTPDQSQARSHCVRKVGSQHGADAAQATS